MAYINSTRTVVNNVGTDIALAGAGNLFTVSGSLGGTKSLTLSDGFINNGAPEANLIVPLLFPNGHNDLGPSLYLEITVAGVTNPIPVVSNQNGTLLPIPHHEMTEGGSTVYKVVDPNTILNVYYTDDYDGNSHPAFVVVGNPLVLSSSTYSIYANGYNESLQIGAQYTSATIITYSTTWTSTNFVFSDVPKGKYQVGWVLKPGSGSTGMVGVNDKIAVYLDHSFNGGTYQTTEIIDASGGQYTYSAEIAVKSPNGAFFTCVLTRIA